MSSTCSSSSQVFDMSPHDRYLQVSDRYSYGLSTLLPTLVQQRLLKLRRIRRVLLHHDSTMQQHDPLAGYTEGESEGSMTAPPSYVTNVDEQQSTQSQPAVLRWMQETVTPSRPTTRPGSSSSNAPTCVEIPGQRSDEYMGSGVQWKYANPGFASVMLAQSEDTRSGASPVFARNQYINGLTCLLHGLPADLSEEEILSISDALPQAIKSRDRTEGQLATKPQADRGAAALRPAARQSTLQQWVAIFTLHVFLAASFILPYLQYLLREAYQFDRRHKISDKVLSSSIDTAAAMRRSTFTIASQVCSMNDGKVGEQLKDLSKYMVQGLSAGVYDGIGEGMQALGLRTTASTG